MNLFLGHTTACLYWLTATQEQCDALRPSTLTPEPLTLKEQRSIPLALQGALPSQERFHVELPRTHHHVEVEGVTTHTCTALAPRAFMRLRKGVYIASPEQTFIQMAEAFSLHDLVLLGTELCSKFVRNEFSPTGITGREPVCTPKLLAKAVENAPKFSGKQKAQKALRFVRANANSPKEVEAAARFGLFRQYGGDGLPAFKCNFRIDIPDSFKHLTSKPFIEADFCWPAQKVVVEYDSDLHTGSEKIAKDTMRRNILVSQGYKVIGITRLQNNSRLEMDRVAEEIAIALGVRRDIRAKNYYTQKRELLAAIDAWLRPSPEAFFEKSHLL